jgi:dihydrofolate reductase
MSKLRFNITVSLDGFVAGPAGGTDVSLGGGADVVQQYLARGLIDEMENSLAPLFLGQGARLFDNLGDARPELEQVRAIEAPGVAHLRYRLA